jgi:hypothetical protein
MSVAEWLYLGGIRLKMRQEKVLRSSTLISSRTYVPIKTQQAIVSSGNAKESPKHTVCVLGETTIDKELIIVDYSTM